MPELPHATQAPRHCTDLFRVFTRMALQGFGGVLAVAQHELVERERWLTRDQFVQTLSMSQVLPGPNVVNMALMIGDRFFGWRGIVAAMGGLLAVPLLVVLGLAALYGQLSSIPVVAGALRGMGAAAAGLVITTALRLAPTLRSSALGHWPAHAFAALTLLMIGVLRWPLVWVVLGLGGVAVALAWRRLAR